jgi:Relaxase/Mobilisation nuclease domain
MAIGKISKGKGFGGVLGYLLDPDKNPRIISGCMTYSKPADLAREFRLVSNLRPSVARPVRHFSISFAPEDGAIDDLTKEAIVFRVLDGLGYDDCHFLAVDHDRYDPGHDKAHDHDHIHILTNAVTLGGKYVKDSFDMYRIQEILREVEQDFGLREIKSSWEVKREKAQAVSLDSDIAQLVKDSLVDCEDLKLWLDRLAQSNVDVRFNLTYKGVARGVTFLKDGKSFKGSAVGASWQVIGGCFTSAATNVAVMEAANLQSQTRLIQLSQIERAAFNHAASMGLVALGSNHKFKSKRLDIRLENRTLSVVRLRPHKLMLKATQTVGGKWEPVGFPHIDLKDIELLERLTGAVPQKFGEIEQLAAKVISSNGQPIFVNPDPDQTLDLDEIEYFEERLFC